MAVIDLSGATPEWFADYLVKFRLVSPHVRFEDDGLRYFISAGLNLYLTWVTVSKQMITLGSDSQTLHDNEIRTLLDTTIIADGRQFVFGAVRAETRMEPYDQSESVYGCLEITFEAKEAE